MWQEIAICIIGLLVVAYLIYKIHRLITRPKQENPCAGCSGCSAYTHPRPDQCIDKKNNTKGSAQ